MNFHEVRIVRDRARLGISSEEFCSIDSQQIHACINWCRKIVPFAQLFRTFGAEVLLPAFDKKLRMRCSNEQWLRMGTCEQLVCPPRRAAQHRINDASLPFRRERHSFMDRCMFGRFEKEELIQTKPQNIAKIALNPGSAQATDPKIQQ